MLIIQFGHKFIRGESEVTHYEISFRSTKLKSIGQIPLIMLSKIWEDCRLGEVVHGRCIWEPRFVYYPIKKFLTKILKRDIISKQGRKIQRREKTV